MKVYVSFHTSSVEAVYQNVKDVYTKDAMLCVSFTDKRDILKFPLCNVWCVRSTYITEADE